MNKKYAPVIILILLAGLVVTQYGFCEDKEAYEFIELSRDPWSLKLFKDKNNPPELSFMQRSDPGASRPILGSSELDFESVLKELSKENSVTTEKTPVHFMLWSKDGKKEKNGYLKDDKLWLALVKKCRVALKDDKEASQLLEDYPPEVVMTANDMVEGEMARAKLVSPTPPPPNKALYDAIIEADSTDGMQNELVKALTNEKDSGYFDDLAVMFLLDIGSMDIGKKFSAKELMHVYAICSVKLSDCDGCELRNATMKTRMLQDQVVSEAYRLMGGYQMAAVCAQAAGLKTLQDYADSIRKKDKAQAEDIDKFVSKSAGQLLKKVPENELIQFLKDLQKNMRD